MRLNYKKELILCLEALKMIEKLSMMQKVKVSDLKKAITIIRKDFEERLEK